MEENSILHMFFSVWYPYYSAEDVSDDSSFFPDSILTSFTAFFREDTNIAWYTHSDANELSDTNWSSDSRTTSLSYQSLGVKDGSGRATPKSPTVSWTAWNVTATIVLISDDVIETALQQNIPVQDYLANIIQDSLERSIRNGRMEERLRDLLGSEIATLSPPGEEVETFQPELEDFMDQLDFSNDAVILRYIGIALSLLCTTGVALATSMARRFRMEYETEARKDKVEREGLRTEDGVNHMLCVGRDQAIKARQSSPPLFQSDASC